MGGTFKRHVATVCFWLDLSPRLVHPQLAQGGHEEADSVALVNDLIKHGAAAERWRRRRRTCEGAAAAAAAAVHAAETKDRLSVPHTALQRSRRGGGGGGGDDGKKENDKEDNDAEGRIRRR